MTTSNGAAPYDGIFDIAQLAHVELLTSDPEGSLKFFTEFLGMQVTERAGQSVYLRGYEEFYHHSLKLTESARPGLGHIGLRARSPEALERRVASIEPTGQGRGWSDGDRGHGPAYRLQLPSEQHVELFFEVDYHQVADADKSPVLNRPQKRPPVGVPVRRIDHATFTAPDVGATRTFLTEHLGFQPREQIVTDDGSVEIGAWMSTSLLVHDLAFTADPAGLPGRFHHVCFWYGIPQHVADAAELLREHGYEIEGGPGKHGLAQGIYLYVWEPGGNRIELYGDAGYLIMDPTWKPIIWKESQLDWGAAIYGVVPDSFFTMATPPVESAAPAEPVA